MNTSGSKTNGNNKLTKLTNLTININYSGNVCIIVEIYYNVCIIVKIVY